MKKRIVRVIAIIVVATLMAALVAACRNESDDAHALPEYVYIPEIISMPEGISEIAGVVYAGDAVFFAASHMDEETFQWENRLYLLDLSTNVISELTNYSPPRPTPDAQGWISLSMGTDPEGNLWVSETGNFWHTPIPDDFDGDEDETWQFFEDLGSITTLRKLDSTGAEVLSLNLDTLSQGSNWFQVTSFQFDGDGNIYISAQGDAPAFGTSGSAVFVLDSEANTLFNIAIDGWGNLFRLSDGSVASFGWSFEGEFAGRSVLQPIDLTTRTLGDPLEIPNNVFDIFPGNDDFDFLFTQGADLYGFKLGSEEPEFLLNWIDSDIASGMGNSTVALLGDGRVLTSSQRWISGGRESVFEVVLLTRTPSADLPERSIITLATLWMGSDVQMAVVEFNRSSTTHRIRVNDYSQFNTEDDWTAGLTRLSTDIIAGIVPDILDVQSLPFRQYVARGILLDLYPLIDADPELSRGSFVEGVLEAAEMDGGLYQIFPSFGVNTLMGHPSVLGPEPGWNMDEFRAVLSANPNADIPLGHWLTRMSFLEQAIMLSMDQYVDWVTGNVYFDTGEFAQLLEFASTFPEELDNDDIFTRGMGRESEAELIAQGRQIMSQMNLWDFWSLQMQYAVFGGELVFKGFPTESRNGSSITANGGLAITTASSDVDGAWSFVRTFLLEEFQTDNVWAFPVNRAAFDIALEEFMSEERGETFMSLGDGPSLQLVALTQAQVDQFLELLRTVSGVTGADPIIMNLVREGADDFFNGRSSAQDAARVIQSRVTTYVAEQS